jgi:hypothetical protein
MRLTSNLWYEIGYPNGVQLIFKFLDTTVDGSARCLTCTGNVVLDVFDSNYISLELIGETCPCERPVCKIHNID